MNDPIPGPGSVPDDGIRIDPDDGRIPGITPAGLDAAVDEAIAKSPAMAKTDANPVKTASDYVVDLARSPHGQTFLYSIIALFMQMEHCQGEVLVAAKPGHCRFTFRGNGPNGARLNFIGEGDNFIVAEKNLRDKVTAFLNRNTPNAPQANDSTPKDGVPAADGSQGGPQAAGPGPSAEPVQAPPAVGS